MLDIEKIRQLVDMMIANDLTEISLRDGDVEVNLRRSAPATADGGPVIVAQAPLPGGAVGPASAPATPAQDDEDASLVPIKSPMVGTFYAAPDPDSPPCVQIGTHVDANTVVCIVEAMKVFNEIKAEVSGTIERVLVKNEKPVEYGQAMFLVRPE